MAQASSGDHVSIHYTGTLDDGTVFDSSKGRDPLAFTLGSGQVIPGFDQAVAGMSVGDRKTTTIPAAEAYGEPREELFLEVPKSQLPDDYEPEVGGQLQMTTSQGQPVPVRVHEVAEETVTLDANHPLAGRDLTFEIELVAVEAG